MYILTKRKIMENADSNRRCCCDIVYEWENIIARELGIGIISGSVAESDFDEMCRKIYKLIHIPFYRLFHLYDKKEEMQ